MTLAEGLGSNNRIAAALLAAGIIAGAVHPALAQEDAGADQMSLPLPELTFQQEEEEPSEEYLVNKPGGYLKLPKWEDSDRMAIDLGQPLHLGGGLWPGQEALIPKIRANFRPKQVASNGFRRPEDPRVSLPDVNRVSPEVIPEAYLPHYFGDRPKRFLTDLQRLLTDSEWQDTDWFLTYHSNECAYNANVLLFSPDEQIPPSVSGAELLAQWFPENDHVLVFYFHGRPERTQVFFPDDLVSRFPKSEFQQNLTEAVDSASKARTPGRQLDEFCQKLGTWLLWWEKRTEVTNPTTTAAKNSDEGRLVGVAPEDLPTVASSENGGESTGYGSVFWGVVGLIVILLTGLIIWTISAALKGKRPVHFPNLAQPTRLGAPHSGGGSVVLTFGSKD